jgi:uncharacterized membrane protein YgdD (TMEM256/DUF423 family)
MLMVVAALAGILGVALSAAAAHSSAGPNLETASRFLLLHAPVLLAIVALAGTGLLHVATARAAGWIMVLGLALFCGDLVSRAYRGAGLFPMAAPTGGFALMGGWALLGVAALVRMVR